MSSNRRRNFRASVREIREGSLIVGSARLPVSILNESSGGFCVAAEQIPDFPTDVAGILQGDDGGLCYVKVKHIEPYGQSRHIGLERIEEGELGALALWSAVPPPVNLSSGRSMVLIGLALGVFIGVMWQAPIRNRLMQIAGFSVQMPRSSTGRETQSE